MERSDEARRLVCLYDRLNQKDRKIKELEAELKENNFIPMPKEWIGQIYNACTEPCDILYGPCACGAWHYFEEWILIRKILTKGGWVKPKNHEIIEQLEAENEKLKRTMRLHAGDCCSLANEVELFKGHWEDAEERVKQLELQLKEKDKSLNEPFKKCESCEGSGLDHDENGCEIDDVCGECNGSGTADIE